MKYYWEPHDVFAGRQVGAWNRVSNGNHVIGYDPALRTGTAEERSNFTLFSLADGMIVCQGMTKCQMAEYLNKGQYRPNTLHDEDVGPNPSRARTLTLSP